MPPVLDPHPIKISRKFTINVHRNFNKPTLSNVGMD